MSRVETFDWICRVISSCDSMSQLRACTVLINRYSKRYTDRKIEGNLLTRRKNEQLNKLWLKKRLSY